MAKSTSPYPNSLSSICVPILGKVITNKSFTIYSFFELAALFGEGGVGVGGQGNKFKKTTFEL